MAFLTKGFEMKKHILNKNVSHNGKYYEKGYVLQPGDIGAAELIAAGHADELEIGEAKEIEVPIAEESIEASEESKPARRSKK